MDKFVRITKNISFEDLKKNRKTPIDVYEEQINCWLFTPLKQLSEDKTFYFENGYAMLGLELLFFEPHGKYLSGDTIKKSGDCFKYGFEPFLNFLEKNKYIELKVLNKLQTTNFYKISRCGIFHDMTIKSGLLIDSIHMEPKKVFYDNPVNNGVLVSSWNFLNALNEYFNIYISELRADQTTLQYNNFITTFNKLFQY